MVLYNTSFIGPDNRLHHEDIRIDGSRIVGIEASIVPHSDERCIDSRGYLIIPALADSHVHTPDTLMKGLFHSIPMTEWCNDSYQGRLQQRLFDFIDTSVGSDTFETLVLYEYLQYIRHGVGFIVETGQADDSSYVLQQCAKHIGLKAIIDWYDKIPDIKTCNPNIAIGMHLPEEENLTEELLKQTVALHKSYKSMPLMTHCLENSWRLNEIRRKFGKSTVELMAEHTLLGANTLLFHCIQISDKDIKLIAHSGASAVCCPVSTMRTGESVMPLAKMLAHGINVAIGTDFLDHDIWECMRFAYTLMCSTTEIQNLPAFVFATASRNAAQFAQRAGYEGEIAVGKPADLCFIEHTLDLDPLIDNDDFSTVLHNLIVSGSKHLVRHLLINGTFILYDGCCTTLDEQAITARYKDILHSLGF